MKYCEKCGKKDAKHVKEYDGYLCDFHAQSWLLINAENERIGIKPWYEYIEVEILEDDEEEY